MSKNIRAIAIVIVLGGAMHALPLQAASPEEKKDFMPIQQAFEDGFFDVVTTQSSQFLEKYPDSAFKNDIRLLLGQSYLNLKDFPKAAEIFEAVVKDNMPGPSQEEGIYW